MKKVKQKSLILLIVMIVSVLLATVGSSYAFFTATITGSETTSTINIGSGTITIAFGGTSTVTSPNIYPQPTAWGTKTFTVTGNNTTAQTVTYRVNLVVDSNTFSANAIKYTLTSTNTGSSGTIVPAISTQTGVSSGASTISLGTGTFANAIGKAHTYGLAFFFPDTGGNQNGDQGKTFTAHVTVVAA